MEAKTTKIYVKNLKLGVVNAEIYSMCVYLIYY